MRICRSPSSPWPRACCSTRSPSACAAPRAKLPWRRAKGSPARWSAAAAPRRFGAPQLSLPPSAAALVNGTAAHAYEFDDFGGCGHSGAVVVPAVCAIAERVHADGRSVLVALAAGYDVAARVTSGAGGYRAHNDLGWHSTGTCGTFGAAAGAARVMGLDPARFIPPWESPVPLPAACGPSLSMAP